MRLLRRLVGLGVAALAGCSVEGLTSAPISLSGGSHGVGASPDATAEDADVSNDAAALDAVADSGTTWCSGQSALFCADFDRGPLPGEFESQNGTYLALASAKDRSPPQALVVTVPSASTGDFSSRLVRSFKQTGGNVSLSFDVSPENLNSNSALAGILVFEIRFPIPSGGAYRVRLAYAQNRARLEESQDGLADVHHPFFDVALQAWVRMQIDLVLQQGAGTMTHTIDGVKVGDYALRVPAQITLQPTLEFGAVYGTNPQSGWLFYFDNLLFEVK